MAEPEHRRALRDPETRRLRSFRKCLVRRGGWRAHRAQCQGGPHRGALAADCSTPVTDFYEAMPDKNGEVWAGVLHGRQMLRFNPKTDHWTVYQMPEPYAYNRRTVIDASTRPVTVW